MVWFQLQVWCIDSTGHVYVRKGVTECMPVGSHWVYVPGTIVKNLVVGDAHVYALTYSDEILVRCGITEDNVMGDCWTKIPGVLTSVSGI